MSSCKRRVELIQLINRKDPVRYEYLNIEPFSMQMSENYQAFPNDFLEALYKCMLQFNNIHQEIMKSDPEYGGKFKEFLIMYQDCLKSHLRQQQFKIIGQNQLTGSQSNLEQQPSIEQLQYLQKLKSIKKGIVKEQVQTNKSLQQQIQYRQRNCQNLQQQKQQKQKSIVQTRDQRNKQNCLGNKEQQFETTKKEIIHNLNLLTPENLKDIQKKLTNYLFNDREVCEFLVLQIIEKALRIPEYATTYAKLCSEFSKIPGDKFKFKNFEYERSGSKENRFRYILIFHVQQSFDRKVEQLPQFQSNQQMEKWLQDTKKKILNNMKFIAELIRLHILRKAIMKICISQLISTFLTKYYYFRKTVKLIDSYYDYYFEALIEFIETVGELYEKMDESAQLKKYGASLYQAAERKVINLIQMKEEPPEEEIEEITNLNAEDYFRLFTIIDQRVLRKVNTRLSALLLNLNQRRNNNWQKHNAESDGPMVKQHKKESMKSLHDLINAMYKDWQNGQKNERAHLKNILENYNEVDFLTACLTQLSDDKKVNVRKRVDLFDIILSYINFENFKTAWFECIKFMAINVDFPFASAAMALVLKNVITKHNTKLKEFYMKTEDEDEEYCINEVFGKLWYYTRLQEIKQFIEPSKKYVNMLEA